MNSITKFFHELINPHCEHCLAQKREAMEQQELDREINGICKTCEVLKIELANANNRITQLLDSVITKPTETPIDDGIKKQVIQTRHTPFSVIRNKLENDSRIEAQRLRDAAMGKAAKPDTHPAQTALLNRDVKVEVSPMIKDLEKELNIGDEYARTKKVNS